MATAQSEAFLHSFRNEYSEGAHPAILKALSQTNLVQEAVESFLLDLKALSSGR